MLCAVSFASGGVVVNVTPLARAADPDETYRALSVFARALHLVQTTWAGDADPVALLWAAERGMIASLDRHSRFYDPAEYRAARQANEEERRSAGDAHATSVSARALEHRLGYVRISRFDEETFDELVRALGSIRRGKEPPAGLALDLRGNPGGILDAAIRIADLWLTSGTIVSTVGRQGRRETHSAHPKGTEPPYPIVALVDEKTASAAEVLVGALQDHGRARIMGTRTFGKGSVQAVIELDDHSAIRLTTAYYFTPRGRSLEETGLIPDVLMTTLAHEDAFVGPHTRRDTALKEAAGEDHALFEALRILDEMRSRERHSAP